MVIGSPCSMMLASLMLLSYMKYLPRLILPPERALLSLCGRWTAYFLEYFLITLHSSEECLGPCNKHVFYCTGCIIAWRACFFCLVLASAALIRVDRWGEFSSLSFPDMTITVGICPSICFRRWFSFVQLFNNFHLLKYGAGFPAGLNLKTHSLNIGLIFPSVGHHIR